MAISLLAGVFNTIINTCIRDISPTLKGILIICFLIAGIFCLSKVIKPKAKPEQNQISVGFLVLTILFFTLLALYIIF